MVRRINAFNIPQYQRSPGKQAACCFQGKTFGIVFAHFLDHCVGFRQQHTSNESPIAIESYSARANSCARNGAVLLPDVRATC